VEKSAAPGVGGGGGGDGGEAPDAGDAAVVESLAFSATLAQEAPISDTARIAEAPPAEAPLPEATSAEQPPAEPQAETLAMEASDAPVSEQVPAPPFWNGWRVLAGLMAVMAVFTGLLAFILYQASKA
ncbi:MAG: hypothetical protein L0Z70_11210, partial [Chloroflexi bacterium]|nr:hypothetical protein [Chloroflexota bacterium]